MPATSHSSYRRRRAYALVGAAGVLVLVVAAVRMLLPAQETTGVGAAGRAGAREMRNLQVGDCLTIVARPDKGRGANGGMNIWHEEVACDKPGTVTYTVGAVGHGPLACPNPNYQEYFEVDDKDKENPRRWTACLRPNLTVGSCYEPDRQTKAFVAVQCGPSSLFKVDSVADVDDPRRCTGAAEAFNFPVPPRTYCVTSLT